MRVRPVPPLGSPGDRPEPKHRTKFPSSDPFPPALEEHHPLRQQIYARIKRSPLTASQVAALFHLSVIEARDHLRIMENYLLVRHTADDQGVISWRWSPANYWELEAVPF